MRKTYLVAKDISIMLQGRQFFANQIVVDDGSDKRRSAEIKRLLSLKYLVENKGTELNVPKRESSPASLKKKDKTSDT